MSEAMLIAGWILWVILAFIAAIWTGGIFYSLKARKGITYATIFQTAGFWLILAICLVTDLNKLHLLWLAPISWIALATIVPSLFGRVPLRHTISAVTEMVFGNDRPTSEDVDKDVGQNLGRDMVKTAARFTLASKDIPTAKREALFNEYYFVLHHLADRVAFNIRGPTKRSDLMDSVAVGTIAVLAVMKSNKQLSAEVNAQDFLSLLNERQNLYSGFDLDKREENEGYAGFLPWEFGKLAATIQGTPKDLKVILMHQTAMWEAFKFLNVNERLQGTE